MSVKHQLAKETGRAATVTTYLLGGAALRSPVFAATENLQPGTSGRVQGAIVAFVSPESAKNSFVQGAVTLAKVMFFVSAVTLPPLLMALYFMLRDVNVSGRIDIQNFEPQGVAVVILIVLGVGISIVTAFSSKFARR